MQKFRISYFQANYSDFDASMRITNDILRELIVLSSSDAA